MKSMQAEFDSKTRGIKTELKEAKDELKRNEQATCICGIGK